MTAIAARRPWLAAPQQGSASAGPRREASRPPVPVLSIRACEGRDPELFFPESRKARAAATAKGICAGCPSRVTCLRGAIGRGEQFGIWGGVNFERKEGQALIARAAAARAAAAVAEATTMPRDLPPMDKAEWLGKLRLEHGTIAATARAAGIGKDRAAMYLDLLELDASSQDRVRAGTLYPEKAAAAVRATRGRRRAS